MNLFTFDPRIGDDEGVKGSAKIRNTTFILNIILKSKNFLKHGNFNKRHSSNVAGD